VKRGKEGICKKKKCRKVQKNKNGAKESICPAHEE